MRTSPSQFETMVTFMEQYGDLSKPATHARGRLASIQHWQELTNLLNSDGSGDTKTTEKWKKVWSDYKNNTKKKAARIHRAAQGTGGGLAVHTKLSDLEHRVLNLIGMQAATGLAIDEAGVSQQEEIVEQNETEPTDEVPNLNMEVLDYVDIEESEDPMLSSRAEIASPPPSSMARPISPNIHVDANVIVEDLNELSPEAPTQSRVAAPRNQPARSGQTTPARRGRVPRRRVIRPAHTEQAAQHFLNSDEEWRRIHMQQHKDSMDIKREQNRIRVLEINNQKEWQAVALRALDSIDNLVNKLCKD